MYMYQKYYGGWLWFMYYVLLWSTYYYSDGFGLCTYVCVNNITI